MVKVKFPKLNSRYWLAAAGGLLVLLFVFWWYYAATHPVEPIVTTVNHGHRVPPIILPSPLPIEAEVRPSVTTISEATQTHATDDLVVSVFDPNKPCPEKIKACFATLAHLLIDPTCPDYKPIWAYYTVDEGGSWLKAGCYATEIDAEKALAKASKGLITPNEAMAQETSEPKAIENKTNESKADKTKSKLVKTLEPTSSETATVAPTVHESNVSKADIVSTESHDEHKVIEVHPKYEASFTAGLGLFTVAKRAYPTEEMRNKALAQWNKDMRILEPDGTLNDAYAIKKPEVTPIPGMH